MFDNNLPVCCISTYATHVNNDVSKHILFDWFDNNLAVCCIAPLLNCYQISQIIYA
jgi:hypothetical protein